MSTEICRAHLHIADGGVSVEVIDEGYGPTLVVSSSSFGNAAHTLKVNTDTKSLLLLGKMLIKASKHNDFTKDYCYKASIYSMTIEGKEISFKATSLDGRSNRQNGG